MLTYTQWRQGLGYIIKHYTPGLMGYQGLSSRALRGIMGWEECAIDGKALPLLPINQQSAG